MSEWHDVADSSQLDADFPLGVEVNGKPVGLYLQDGQVRAMEDVCPHADALLSQGFVDGEVVECPLHGARFEIATGKCLNEIGERDLKCYPAKIENGRVVIQIVPA